jgi:hypothetical protein
MTDGPPRRSEEGAVEGRGVVHRTIDASARMKRAVAACAAALGGCTTPRKGKASDARVVGRASKKRTTRH